MLVTALNPVIGYDKVAEVALYAHEKKIRFFQPAVNDKGYLIDQSPEDSVPF